MGLGVDKRSSGGGRGLAGSTVGTSRSAQVGVPVGMRILEGDRLCGLDGGRKLGL